jgi:hypothetical protein
MIWSNTGFATRLEKRLQTFVFEMLDHKRSVVSCATSGNTILLWVMGCSASRCLAFSVHLPGGLDASKVFGLAFGSVGNPGAVVFFFNPSLLGGWWLFVLSIPKRRRNSAFSALS